jgi:hypothetical protein
MSLLFRARSTDGLLSLWFQVLGDLLFHAPKEHWSTLKQDLRHSVRQLRRSPGFSAVVIATLALGIGGTTAVFSVTHAVLLAPGPAASPGSRWLRPGWASSGGLAATHCHDSTALASIQSCSCSPSS